MNTLLEISNLIVRYGTNTALEGVSLTVRRGEFLAVMGPNGGGKTTLLRVVLGLLKPAGGAIRLHTGKIGYVPQSSAIDRAFPITVAEVVGTARLTPGLHPRLWRKKADRDAVLSCLERVGLASYQDRPVSALSGGEFQRLLIARALATDPELLLLDEPTANIDPASREQIYSVLKRLVPETTVVLITHDLSVLHNAVSRLIYLGGSVLYDGAPTLTPARMNELYGYRPRGVPPVEGGRRDA